MNTIIKYLGVCACMALYFSPPIKCGNNNPEAQRVLQSLNAKSLSKARVYKILIDADQEEEWFRTFNIIEPKPTFEARKSKKKDIISEAMDEGEKDLAGYLKANGGGSMNEFDAAYARFYLEYQAWKIARFNVIYVVTNHKNNTDYSILGAVTGFSSQDAQQQNKVDIRNIYTPKELDSIKWTGMVPGALSDELKRIIFRLDAEEITILPTKPSRKQIDELERSRLAHAVEGNAKDIQIFSIPHEQFQLIHASLVPPIPSMSAEANTSKKKDIIMEGVDEGEADIAMYIKLNGGSQMNNSDREFERYYSMLQKYTDNTFESAYIVTNKKSSSMKVLGLLLSGVCIPPTKIADCLHKPKKTLLAKECSMTKAASHEYSLLDYLNKLIADSTCKNVYP